MSLFNKNKPIRTYKDKHGATVRVISEAKGPNRKQRRNLKRIDYGVPYYDKHPHATHRDAHLKAVERRKRLTRAKLDAPLEERQRHNAIMRASYKAGHAERVARREARKQESIARRLARV